MPAHRKHPDHRKKEGEKILPEWLALTRAMRDERTWTKTRLVRLVEVFDKEAARALVVLDVRPADSMGRAYYIGNDAGEALRHSLHFHATPQGGEYWERIAQLLSLESLPF